MNSTPFSSQLQYSPPLPSGGEYEDATSSDSPTNWSSASPFSNQLILNDEAVGFPKKRKAGRRKFKETRHPIYHGVRVRDGGKWVCEIREPNKKSRIWLGTYPTAELAARAHDVGAIALRGDKAVLNFPDSAWLAPRAKSTSAKDIRLAAFQATRSELRSSSPSGCGKKIELEVDSPTSRSSVNHYFGTEGDIGEGDSKESLFIDEEAIFNYPSLINGMAAGMLLTPPCLKRGINWDTIHDYGDNSYIDYMDLWHHL
ncbi:dehydration-responsive element-binding protein 1F-like [Chenopodium quinoa]|uniref:AP2/ERF domain-containing protein n=1 Tax=Chenopodium quinoa TaxID=63459 RepID=A0A803LD68_CHEQI|nr:dehydration-responsive element-binding protein 1F-like [Chenopodium quinoa]